MLLCLHFTGYFSDIRPKYRSPSASSSTNPSRFEDVSRSRPDTSHTSKHRTSSLELRSAEAYYKHLDRFKVPRTKSWVNLQV